jgi:integrase
MKGKVYRRADSGKWGVSWYCSLKRRNFSITRYTPTWIILSSPELAESQLNLMRADWEWHLQGRKQWRIEKYLHHGTAEVIDTYNDWLDLKGDEMAPATLKGYRSYRKCHFAPFFTENPKRLTEIDVTTLIKLKKSLKNKKTGKPLSGKGKLNVMMAFHLMMEYAQDVGLIDSIPKFPKKKDFGLTEESFAYLSREDQLRVADAVDPIDRPIILFLIYHYRRPSEACALFKTDYNPIENSFTVCRAFSARELIDRTKTGAIHHIPCDDVFTDIAKKLLNQNIDSNFLFVNPRARKEGRHYTDETVKDVWDAACKKIGLPPIGLYEGTKHSSCTHFVNVVGGHDAELQMLTDHANIESVKKYRRVGVERKRELMRKGRVIQLPPKAKEA